MGPERSLPHSQVPATCPLSRASSIQSIHPHPTSWRSILILPTHLRLGIPSGLYPSDFLTQVLYTPLLFPIRATWPAHLILLDHITWTILGEQYRSLSSSVCSFLHSPVTSLLLGPNILLNTLSLHSSLSVSELLGGYQFDIAFSFCKVVMNSMLFGSWLSNFHPSVKGTNMTSVGPYRSWVTDQ
jgi:hypothetical protein